MGWQEEGNTFRVNRLVFSQSELWGVIVETDDIRPTYISAAQWPLVRAFLETCFEEEKENRDA